MLKIVSPISGSLVNMEDYVQIISNRVLPKEHKIYLYIRDPIGQWWSWGEIKENNKMKVQFGVTHDKNERFEVRALLSDETIPKGGPHVNLPRSIASDSVIVMRK